jgi:hypothetical protein
MYGTTRDGFEVAGALQDGFSNLRLRLRDGTVLLLTPKEGFFYRAVGSGPVALTFTAPDGTKVRQPLG